MPYIRTVNNPGTASEETHWIRISEYDIDGKTGNLLLFRMAFTDGTTRDFHLFKRDIHLSDIAAFIFTGATSLRSAKGLLEELNKVAGKEGWHKRAGYAGLSMGTAAMLHEFLKTKPFHKEGYYDGAGNLFLARVINTREPKDYDPKS